MRRLWTLVTELPLESRVWREERPNWTQQDEFFARLVEGLDYWGWEIVAAINPKLAKKLPKPKPLEHPDRKRPKRRRVEEQEKDPNAIARFFGVGRKKGGE